MVHSDPFSEIKEVRRGVKARLISGFHQNGMEHGRGRPLAIGPGNENGFKSMVRVSQASQKGLRGFQSGPDAELYPGIEKIKSIRIVHDGMNDKL